VGLELNFIFPLSEKSKLIKSFDDTDAACDNLPLFGIEFNFEDNGSLEHKI
jgi:hypothetical protein